MVDAIFAKKYRIMNNDTLSDILKHTGKVKLDAFIQEYAQGDATFKNAFIFGTKTWTKLS